ncbi:MAG: hypothetical protein WCQ49_02610 [Candidatus Saccharibacteria bacterium]
MTKKTIIMYALISISLVLIISAATILTINIINQGKTNEEEKNIATKTLADSLKVQAIESMAANTIEQTDKAKTLLEEAKIKYTELNDKDNLIDIESLLSQTTLNKQLQLSEEINATPIVIND